MGPYIRDVNWISYLRGVFSGGEGIYGGVLTGFYGILTICSTHGPCGVR